MPDVFVATECKNSRGTRILQQDLEKMGYGVCLREAPSDSYSVLVASRLPSVASRFHEKVDYLAERVCSVRVITGLGTIEIVGIYIPSRDASPSKIARKRTFLQGLESALAGHPRRKRRVICGDFNILEPTHVPHYSVFRKWEYEFYDQMGTRNLHDSFRHLHRGDLAYSWVGRTGDGYRYDHAFVSEDLLRHVAYCQYDHEPRNTGLSDHSALLLWLTRGGSDLTTTGVGREGTLYPSQRIT